MTEKKKTFEGYKFDTSEYVRFPFKEPAPALCREDFVLVMARQFAAAEGRRKRAGDWIRYAAVCLNEYLSADGIAFGAEGYEWNEGAAKALAAEDVALWESAE